jgi:hypothetical protein
MTKFFRSVLLGGCLSMASLAAHAQSLTLDDFTTGPTEITLKHGTKTTYQTGGRIIGGNRGTSLLLNTNVFNQSANIQIRKGVPQGAPSALVFSEGFQDYARLDMYYGSAVTGTPLHLDVTAYDRFRIHFAGINGILNFNILAFTGSAYSQWGCNLSPTFTATTVDMPFANAVVGGAQFSSLDSLDFIFQSQGEGNDFGVTQIEFVPAGTPPADVTCGPIGG